MVAEEDGYAKVNSKLRLWPKLKAYSLKTGFYPKELVGKMQLLGSVISRSGYSMIELGTRNIKVTDLVALQRYTALISRSFSKALSLGSSIDLNSITLKLTRGDNIHYKS